MPEPERPGKPVRELKEAFLAWRGAEPTQKNEPERWGHVMTTVDGARWVPLKDADAEVARLNGALDNMRGEYMTNLNRAEAEVTRLREEIDDLKAQLLNLAGEIGISG